MIRQLVILTIILPLFATAQNRPSPRSMTTEQIQNERYGIQELQRQVALFRSTGSTIRDGACSTYWRRAEQLKKQLSEVPNSWSSFSYKEKRDNLRNQSEQQRALYRQCFTQNLPRHAAVYNHPIDPAKSYESFISTFRQRSGELQQQQARFHDLGQELRVRGQ